MPPHFYFSPCCSSSVRGGLRCNSQIYRNKWQLKCQTGEEENSGANRITMNEPNSGEKRENLTPVRSVWLLVVLFFPVACIFSSELRVQFSFQFVSAFFFSFIFTYSNSAIPTHRCMAVNEDGITVLRYAGVGAHSNAMPRAMPC